MTPLSKADTTSHLANWRAAAVATLPVMFGYLPLGAAFGILAVDVGIPWWAAMAMSILIYAGAGQFLAVALLANQAGLMEVAVATLMLNSRHLFYGLSLLRAFAGAGWRKPYLVFSLTDETYSLLTSQEGHAGQDHAQAFRLSALNQLWWVLGSLAGVLIGSQLAFDTTGIEFVLTALFIVLTIEQARRLRRWLPFIVATFTALGALALLPERHMLLGAIGAASLILLLQYRLGSAKQRTAKRCMAKRCIAKQQQRETS
ncbi:MULTISPECIES: AzlC family ABC transporter permease [Halomonadaceae]|uniref:AzlC family ABC transporter permease n=1 Tax=Halomonadaceae TaxID=28256 RepID=UPI001582DEBC|nr:MULTISPECIES: AzlC family ABC transporter permease [Halomonas]MDI4638405.1 AzlC family ABC transporter permease [Halomonas sp. BMC7]NUJ59393.1 AzlC family ABC transporter permease [Halomonas taeanensis]